MPLTATFGGVSLRNYGFQSGSSISIIGDFESIATQTIGTATTSVTFSSIPQTYTHLQLRHTGFYSVSNNMYMRYNGDTTAANYSWHHFWGDGANPNSNGGISAGFNYVGYATNATNPMVFVSDILDYSKTTKSKTIKTLTGQDNNGSGEVALWSGAYFPTTAISSITIIAGSGNININSKFALYGINS